MRFRATTAVCAPQEKERIMNTNYKTKITAKWLWQGFSALFIFVFAVSAFSQTPTLRANGKIAFTSERDGNQEIYVMNNDGTGQARLTNNPAIDYLPAFSPDGRKIAFVSQLSIGSSAVIKIMNADGTNQVVVTSFALSAYPYTYNVFRSLSWSPNGRKIAFDEEEDIFTVNIDGSNRTNLTNHPAMDFAPAWSPDGSRILFISSRGSGYWTTHTLNAIDGSDVRVLQSSSFSDDSSPDWSPNGDKIVLVVIHEDYFPALYTANADGTNRQIFDGIPFSGAQRNKPKWSPDGTKIVFDKYTFASMDSEIYMKNVNGSGLTQLTNTNGNNYQPSWQPVSNAISDFDGDGRSDISVFRPSDRTWYLNQSTNGFYATQFGLSTDKLTPADFDGDGKTDIAVFRDGVWYRLNSSNQTVGINQFGLAGDIPVSADFTGDGRTELAIYRNGVWWMLDLPNNQVSVIQFGTSTDKPVAGDYDGDGRADQAVYRGNGEWHLNHSMQDYKVVNFGLANDTPTVGDYDGDGRADQAVYRDGTWYLLQSTQGFTAFQFGISSDVPAPADYDGDGKTDAAVYRNGTWYLMQSTNGIAIQQFGLLNDKPVSAAYLP